MAKVYRYKLEKLNDACAAWRDKNEIFNLGLEKFGVDIDALKIVDVSKRYLRCWREDWENPLLKNNDPVARAKLSEKYRVLVFRDIDIANKVLYTVSRGHMEYKRRRKGGWAVLAEPFDCDRTDLDCLEPFQINEDTLI